MDDRKLLIVGIDPGTTTAYAVLDIEGNLIHVDSSKQLDLKSLISGAIKLGKVVLVGTDKANVPRLVEAFATKVGARIVSPKEDLKVNEKRNMTSNFNFNDEHQGDALASALFACKSTKALLDKIDLFAKNHKKHSIKDRIKELVITKKMSIKSAVSILEKKDEAAQIMEKVIADKRLSENDFLRLYNKLKRYETEINLMKVHNANLNNRISDLEKQIRTEGQKNNKRTADFREQRIRRFEGLIRHKDKEIEQLKYLIKKFNNILSNINNFYILKKLDSLSLNEFNFKNKILDIQSNDILLVDDLNVVSDSLVNLLKDKIFVIIHKKPISKNIEDSLPFVFISAKSLRIDEDRYFGFVKKRDFEMEKSKVDWVSKIINDYKREKEELYSRTKIIIQ